MKSFTRLLGAILSTLSWWACSPAEASWWACSPEQAACASISSARLENPSDDVARVLDNWHDAAAKADFDRYFAHFAPSAIFMGTDATERWTVDEFKAYAKPHFDKGKAWSFTPHNRHVAFSSDGDIAWFDEELKTPNLGPCRGSGVLVLTDAMWKIAHYNLALAVPNGVVDDVVRMILAENEHALNVMSFNIRYNNSGDGENAWPRRRAMVAEFLKAHKPDIIGLQEVLNSQLKDLSTDLPDYAFIGVGRDDGKEKGEYAAIMYRRDRFAAKESGTFWFSDTPDVVGTKSWGNNIVRICTWARFVAVDPARDGTRTERPDSEGFYVYNVHLDHESQPSRERSADLFLERLDARSIKAPFVLTGDFNAGEANVVIRKLKTLLLDTFRMAHPEAKIVGTFNSFKGETGGDKIDYIFVPQLVTTRSATIHRDNTDGRYLSDHFPVSARIVLPKEP